MRRLEIGPYLYRDGSPSVETGVIANQDNIYEIRTGVTDDGLHWLAIFYAETGNKRETDRASSVFFFQTEEGLQAVRSRVANDVRVVEERGN